MNGTNGSKPTVLVVDDHRDLLENIAGWLQDCGYYALTAADGDHALRILKRIRTDVVVTDLEMPGMSGLDLLDAIKASDPHIQVIVLTGHATVDNAVAALRQGKAYDFLQKPLQDLAQLKAAIDQSLAAVDKPVPQPRNDQNGFQHPLPALTEREREVLQLLMQGLDNNQIADRLYVSEKTVRNHLTQAYRKLGVTNRVQAVVFLQNHPIIIPAKGS